MANPIVHNLAGLARFSGRDSRRLFWPYASLIVVLLFVAAAMVVLPEVAQSMARMQRFAAAHPEAAMIQSSPGSYSISIEGNHPELAPDFAGIMGGMAAMSAAAIGLLAAAVVRRLHDRGKSGAWGALPLPFLAFGAAAMPHIMASFGKGEPDITAFFAMFVNNILYLASLFYLVMLLGGAGTPGLNRYGPDPET
jgi:uncharacterized membrane protein YhaH (DUF805 family)